MPRLRRIASSYRTVGRLSRSNKRLAARNPNIIPAPVVGTPETLAILHACQADGRIHWHKIAQGCRDPYRCRSQVIKAIELYAGLPELKHK